MEKAEAIIIGYGVVGKNTELEFSRIKMDVYDKYKEIESENAKEHHKFAFICVDTPLNSNGINDITEVKRAIEDTDADYFILKSTVLPGTTDMFRELRKKVVFSPEYYGGTQHANNRTFNFTILGGNKEDCIVVQQFMQKQYDASHVFRIVDAKTAEIVKYMENAWLATKVSFMHQFLDIAEDNGVAYEDVRELFVLDPRVNPSHTFVYRDHPFWDSHCLNKDVPAIAEYADADLLKAVIAFNEKRRKEWESHE